MYFNYHTGDVMAKSLSQQREERFKGKKWCRINRISTEESASEDDDDDNDDDDDHAIG